MNKLMKALMAHVKMLTSAPSDREIKLREMENAEIQMHHHVRATAFHETQATFWTKRYEKARVELSESI